MYVRYVSPGFFKRAERMSGMGSLLSGAGAVRGCLLP